MFNVFSLHRTLGLYTTLYLINIYHGWNTRGKYVIFTSIFKMELWVVLLLWYACKLTGKETWSFCMVLKRNYLLWVHFRFLVFCVVCLPFFGAFFPVLPVSLHFPFWICSSLFITFIGKFLLLIHVPQDLGGS